MKRFLLSGLIVLASLATVAPAHAKTFGLFVGCGRCCRKCCCSTFCVRQYNAFSPVCCGTLCCDGCMPFCCGMPAFACGGCGMYPPAMGGWGCCPQMCSAAMCCPTMDYPVDGEPSCCVGDVPSEGCTLPAAPSAQPMPTTPAKPLPPPTPGATQSNAQSYPGGYAIQPVSYYPAYGYNPAYGYGYAPAAPSYPMMSYWFPMAQIPYYWSPTGGR